MLESIRYVTIYYLHMFLSISNCKMYRTDLLIAGLFKINLFINLPIHCISMFKYYLSISLYVTIRYIEMIFKLMNCYQFLKSVGCQSINPQSIYIYLPSVYLYISSIYQSIYIFHLSIYIYILSIIYLYISLSYLLSISFYIYL